MAVQVLAHLGVHLGRLPDVVIQTVSSSSTASSRSDTAEAVGAYVELPNRVRQLLERLESHSDPEVADAAAPLRSSTSQFNGVGVERLVGLVMAWRGERRDIRR